MFAQIEPVDEFLAFRSCFLLLDLQAPLCLAHGGPAHPSAPNIPRSGSRPRPSLSQPTSLRPPPPPQLLQRQLEKAAEVLAYLERSYAMLTKSDGGRENGSAESRDSADGASSLPSDWPNKRSARRPPTDISPEEVRSALNLYKAKLALLARSSKSSKREIKTTLNACAQDTTGLFLKAPRHMSPSLSPPPQPPRPQIPSPPSSQPRALLPPSPRRPTTSRCAKTTARR